MLSCGLFLLQKQERCVDVMSDRMTCLTPKVPRDWKVVSVWFELDNLELDFESITGKKFTFHPDPTLSDLADAPYRFKPGGVIAVEVRDLFK